MKKVMLFLIAITLLLNISLAESYNCKITIKGIDLIVTREAGNIVNLESKLDEITSWNVIKGEGVKIENNQFTMPNCYVEIEAIIEENEDIPVIPYTLTTFQNETNKITGIYVNNVCSVCGGRAHECEVINITIEAENAIVTEI